MCAALSPAPTQDKVACSSMLHQGTLFLDEIGDMPLATQAKLLRVPAEPGNSARWLPYSRKVDVRVVAATNKDLRQAIARKEFREDLYYRLSMVEIAFPGWPSAWKISTC